MLSAPESFRRPKTGEIEMDPVARTIANDVYEQLRHGYHFVPYAVRARRSISSPRSECDVEPGRCPAKPLSKLSAEGLVDAGAQRGYTVSQVSPRDLAELTDARVRVEQECLKLAIEKGGLGMGDGYRGRASYLGLNHTPYTIPGDAAVLDQRWVKAHREFHRALVSACGNRWLLRIRSLLYDQSERYPAIAGAAGNERNGMWRASTGILRMP